MSTACSVCYLVFGQEDIQCATLCGHLYHEICLLEWFKTSNICPLCRGDLTADEHGIKFHRVFPKFTDECSSACEKIIAKLQQDINESRQRIHQLEEVDRFDGNDAAAAKKSRERNARMQQLEIHVSSLRRQLNKCSYRLDNLNTILIQRDNSIKNHESKIQEISQNNNELTNKCQELTQDVKLLTEELEIAHTELEKGNRMDSNLASEQEIVHHDTSSDFRVSVPPLNSKFYCHPCGKEFRDKRDLNRHYDTQIHKEILKDTLMGPCLICGKRMYQKNIERHIKCIHQ